jgi:ubiquinone/menaquinone biosynthesis C-methylase UbiE
MNKQKSDWWFDFFPVFRPILGKVSIKATNSEVAFIIRRLGLKSGMRFLDCPCGIGRISIPLAKTGIKVTGVDIIGEYLDEVALKAEKRKLPITLIESDMRRIDFESEFDAAANMLTSFGYFKRESDNLLVIKKLYKALKPGGKTLIHTINRDWLIKYFTSRDWNDIGGIRVFQSREIDYQTSIMNSRWRFLKDGKEREFDIQFRIYSYHELYNMMATVGFENIQGYGSTNDDPIGSNSRMMFLIGEKI